jgi:hypothetical protein
MQHSPGAKPPKPAPEAETSGVGRLDPHDPLHWSWAERCLASVTAELGRITLTRRSPLITRVAAEAKDKRAGRGYDQADTSDGRPAAEIAFQIADHLAAVPRGVRAVKRLGRPSIGGGLYGGQNCESAAAPPEAL